MKFYVYSLAFVLTFCFANGIEITKCQGSSTVPNGEDIEISKCEKPPCELKKLSTIYVKYKIVPDKDATSVTNSVSAVIGGIPFPFIGVNGNDACPSIKDENGKPGCPLKAGQTYYYKNQFVIQPMYPLASFVVHWALKDSETDAEIFCFEVPARITKAR